MLYDKIEQLMNDCLNNDATIDKLQDIIKLINRIKKTNEYDTLTKEQRENLNDWWYDADETLDFLLLSQIEEGEDNHAV